jgi:uncharacterized protein
MKKKLIILLQAFLFIVVSISAQSRVADNAGLLSGGEIQELEWLLAGIASTYNFDLVIVTETSIGGASPMDYADDYFDYNGYGPGADRDGCLLLQVTETRDWWFSTSGRGIGILNSVAGNRLEKDVVKFLRRDEPAGAYRAFVSDWEKFLILDAKGKRYSFIREYSLALYIGAWVVSLIIALVAVQIMKAKMNTALPKTEAEGFIVPGSLVFTKQKDVFLYSTITKNKRVQSSSSSGAGTHISSSGRTHGGRGGKY